MSTQRDQTPATPASTHPNHLQAKAPGPYFLEGADRVLRLLDAFTAETPELRLTDLSDRLGIPKSQALRIATTLEHSNYLFRDPATKRYRLGMRLFSLGNLVERNLDLKQVAQPAFQELADASAETVGLFVIDRDGPICIDVRESPKGLRVFAQVGRRMPWNAGASGKVALAFLPEFEREGILEAEGFQRFTERTITDSTQLNGVIERTRRLGYAIGVGDLSEDAFGIGAPIFRHDRQLAGAVSLSAPIDRAPESEWPRLIGLVIDCANTISRQLGFDPSGNSPDPDRE